MKRFVSLFLVLFFIVSPIFAENKKVPIEVKGNTLSYLEGGKRVVAKGDVVITYENMRLTCDEAEVYLPTNTAKAKGHIVLVDSRGVMHGDAIEYDFENQRGKIIRADFEIKPYYGAARRISRQSENHYRATSCYITTCDPSVPHPLNYRLEAEKIDIYPNEKVVARKVRFKVGRYTFLYFPKYTHYLNDKRPKVKVVPGKDKEWGSFVLTSWKQSINDNLDVKLNIDYRDKRGLGFGPDLFYHSKFGSGVLRTYYIEEKDKGFLEELGGRRPEERYKIQLLHKWDISKTDRLIAEYHKFSDYYLLKDYYYNDEYEYDPEPASYVFYSKSLDGGSLSVYTKKRVNHFYTETEYLPQLKYQHYPVKLGDSDFYLSGSFESDFLAREFASGDENDTAFRTDAYVKLLCNKKILKLDFSPFVAMRQTYYSRDVNSEDRIRGVFYTGFDLSTKLYRIFDVYNEFWDLNKIRHIVRPWVKYRYNPTPTVEPNKLQYFDSLDTIDRTNNLSFGMDNLFQTKRNNESVDIMSLDLDAVYRVKPERGSYLDYMDIDWSFYPFDWIDLDFEYRYGIEEGSWRTGSFDLWIEPLKNVFSLGLGHQYRKNAIAQTILETDWNVVKGWEFKTYHRYEFETGAMQEQTYSIIKDLKCWELELAYTDEKYNGSTFWFILRIKAFPDIGVRLTKSYRKRRE